MKSEKTTIFNTNKKHPVFRLATDFIFLIIFLFLLIFVIILPQYSYDMNATIMDKIARAKSDHAPQLLLVGDSNLVFGVDSEKLEKELGVPVVNMGLHAGLGDRFLLKTADYYAEPGDIVVVSLVKYNTGEEPRNEELKWVTLENHFSLYKFISPDEYYYMYKAFPSYLRDAIKLWTTGNGNIEEETGYSRSYFNEYGDSKYERPEPIAYYDDSEGIPDITDEFVREFNDLCKRLNDRGVRVVLAAYPIYECESTPTKEEFADFESELRSKLDCEIISDFTEYFMDKELFWDSKYHLNDRGVPIRTQLLVNDISAYMNE